MISEKDLVSVLTDIYITDGLLAMPEIHQMFSSPDSLSSYYQTIEKHGFSKESMDKTMKYYVIKKPKKLIQIYDQVLGILSEMESYLEIEIVQEQERIRNLWSGNELYFFPNPYGTDTTHFSIILKKAGTYELKFSVTLFPDDLALNPRITAYSCNSDSITTGKKNYIKTITYLKDGQPHDYTLTVKVPQNESVFFEGWLYDLFNDPNGLNKHAIIGNISLTTSSLTV